MASANKIDWALIEWTNNHDLNLTDFRSRSHEKDMGCFDIETLEVTIHLPDEEFETVKRAIDLLYDIDKRTQFSESEIAQAEEIFLRYFQVHSHEYFHLYQTLFLPVASQLRLARFNKLKYESGLIYHCFDQNKTFKLSRLKELTDVFEVSYGLALKDGFISSYNRALEQSQFYEQMWGKELNGISCHHIFESMAHIASLQLSDEPEENLNQISGDEYWDAFAYYESRLTDPSEKQVRFRYLIFLYICYYSLQVVDQPEDDCNDSITVQTFMYLCELSDFFFHCVERQKGVYESGTSEQLMVLDRWQVSQYLNESNSETISSIYALLETIEIIAKKTEEFRPNRLYRNQTFTRLIKSTEKYNLVNDDFLLAKLVIFPLCFSGIYSWSCEEMDDLKDNDNFTLRQEAQFYKFTKNLRNLFKDRRRKSIPLYCCEEHGYIDDERSFLTCTNDDSCANKIFIMTQRKAYNVFELV